MDSIFFSDENAKISYFKYIFLIQIKISFLYGIVKCMPYVYQTGKTKEATCNQHSNPTVL